jgi:purine-binding chemotaxis protein CheW
MDSGSFPALLLPIGDDVYAVRADSVREVVKDPRFTELATAQDSVVGLINLRGEIVPLLDTARLLGIGSRPDAEFAVIVESDRGLAAFATTAYPSTADLLEPIEASELPATTGIYEVAGRPIVLLDPSRLVSRLVA